MLKKHPTSSEVGFLRLFKSLVIARGVDPLRCCHLQLVGGSKAMGVVVDVAVSHGHGT